MTSFTAQDAITPLALYIANTCLCHIGNGMITEVLLLRKHLHHWLDTSFINNNNKLLYTLQQNTFAIIVFYFIDLNDALF